MNVCEVCGKPIPRTREICEDCEHGAVVAEVPQEFHEPDDEYEDEE